ncbi:PWWP domain-containing protein MUM1-like isoform X2 [Cynoglossus semilaevis]|nr:PWWP domain-containing protein MUM1-like isoform X2 [Cynoglossus semilaevis]
MELSPDEKHRPSLSFQPESESEEDQDEDLPSFLMQMDKKPVSVTEGTFVWHKFRKYPFWPALVKSVNRRLRKASIIFIDDLRIHKKKGFSVALKLLKPFDCDEAEELMSEAKEKSEAVLKWSTDLIADYRIRIACGSFSGSFVDYFAHDMSYPVRRKYPQEASERFTIPSDAALEEFCVALDESLSEENGTVVARSRRTLPDRTSAAHNRATGRLVYYIVDQRLVEDRLLAVLRGQQQSRWLQAFLSTNKNRRVVNYYLEDDHQLDQVYCYLNQLYAAEMSTAACLTQVSSMERVPFVLDVLLPEAIIYAIAGVEKVSVQTAEEKYLKGRSLSHRERQEFDIMIEQLVQQRSDDQNSSLSLLPPCDCT